MIFFTDITTDASHYCLLNINRYSDQRKYQKKMIFVDPGVYELKKKSEYSKIGFMRELIPNLELNEYISIDYPCDMSPQYSKDFIQKSIDNNWAYHSNPKYICTIQFRFHNYADFKYRIEELSPIWKNTNKILGIGNMCRIRKPDVFTDYVFSYLNSIAKEGMRIHFYGLWLSLIRKYLGRLDAKCHISVDSTKWTQAVTTELKLKYGLNARKNTRNEFFLAYMQEINNAGINVIY